MKVITLYQNEKRLIKRAIKNDRLAQKTIYEQHSPKMLSVCRMYIKDLQNAEDVLLKGFFKVFQNLKNFREEGSFEGWIRRIMVRECIDFLRSQKQLYFSDNLERDYKVEHQRQIDASEAAYIQQLIDELPEGYKLVFVLAAIEGYKHSEIAKMLNISEGTSKSQLAKARKKLQERLKNQKDLRYGI